MTPPSGAGETWQPYALPLRQPWTTAHGQLHVRHGRLLRLTDGEGRSGWGDAAPWPEFGINAAHAEAFARETAQLDLEAQRAGLALHAFLGGPPERATLAVNASLGSIFRLDPNRLAAALSEGYRVLKLKMGEAPWQEEIARLHALARQLPTDARLRLDANQAWNHAEALEVTLACNDLPVESLEEPLYDADRSALARLQARARFRLAIDESAIHLDQHFFDAPPVQRVVIKPARHGGLRAALALGRQALAAGMDCVVTTALESACGTLACAHLAAALAPTATHGLATGKVFSTDTGRPAVIEQGKMRLPAGPGLGFVPAA